MIPFINRIWIEEILQEASAYGLRNEVIKAAYNYMSKDPQLDEINAYQMAYLKFINKHY